MLTTTHKLIEYLKLDKQERVLPVICSMVNAIVKCGNKTDADAVLQQYLANPNDFHYGYLLPVFETRGDDFVAEQIFHASITHNKLHENANPEIMEVLGALQYAPIKQILAGYIFGDIETDYYTLKSAVLGLLHFDCSEYEHNIETAIEKCYGKNLFPEFVPALVCKLKNNHAILEKLYELGSEYASTDCNAGILLGFSLCGEQGSAYFRKALFDSNWEAGSTGTGTVHFAYKGLKNLGITFKELYYVIKNIPDKQDLAYCLSVFFALLERRLNDIEINNKESFDDIYTTLFKWKNASESDNITDLAESVNETEKAYETEKLIQLKMNEEAILNNYIIQHR